MDKQLPYPTLSAKLSWAERYAKMSSNGIDARLFSLVCDLHQCSVSPAWCGDASPALLLSVLIITSVWNHVLHCLLWHLNIPQTMKVLSRCVCVCMCVCPLTGYSQLTLTTVHFSSPNMNVPTAYILPNHAVCCVIKSMYTVSSGCFLSYFPSWIRQGLSEGRLITSTVAELSEDGRNPHRSNENYRKEVRIWSPEPCLKL